jgi:hypothetical protein
MVLLCARLLSWGCWLLVVGGSGRWWSVVGGGGRTHGMDRARFCTHTGVLLGPCLLAAMLDAL